MNTITTISYVIIVLCLLALWIYYIVASKRKGLSFPWIFPIFIILRLVIGVNVGIKIGNLSINLYIPLLLLLGLLLIERKHIYDDFITWKNLGISILFGLLFGILFYLLFTWAGQNQLASFSKLSSNPWSIIEIIATVPLVEECLYPGFILGSLKKVDIPAIYAVTIQSVLFTIDHLGRYLPTSGYLPLLLVLLFGFVSGSITWKTKNLSGAVLMHSIVTVLAGAILPA